MCLHLQLLKYGNSEFAGSNKLLYRNYRSSSFYLIVLMCILFFFIFSILNYIDSVSWERYKIIKSFDRFIQSKNKITDCTYVLATLLDKERFIDPQWSKLDPGYVLCSKWRPYNIIVVTQQMVGSISPFKGQLIN